MNANKLAGLEPASVFAYFEKLCSIPHGSGNTKAISDYLVSFAKEHGVRYIQDALNNIILFADGTAGYEDHPPVILQGHMDMVCEKDADCPIDMATEGLDITHDGKFVFANGTTLGADDGIAVAFALAILSDSAIPHPPLEIIITVDEETGMFGAADIDLSMLKGHTMLNLDSDAEGVFTVSCAGGCRSTISLPFSRRPVYGPCVKLVVDGLRGGHSGVSIHKKLCNANKVMGEFLSRVEKLMPLCITKLSGGDKDNAIPRTCEVTLVAMGTNIERINGVAEALQNELRDQFDEPELVVYGEDVDALGGNALSTSDSSKVIALLCASPNGVQTMSEDIEGLVQTSLNLGVVRLEDKLSMTFAVRSSVGAEKRELLDRLSQLAKFYDAEYMEIGDYPAWEYRKDSPLRETMVSVFERIYGRKPKVEAIHAGLECGLLSEKIPNLDCVAMGPTAYDIHTSRERLDITSTKRTYAFVLEVLKAL